MAFAAASAPARGDRQRGRHIPAAVRRALFERDGNRCSYVGATGEPCAEGRHLEFHHVRPFAAGGEHTASNLTLHCRAHNALAAEEDFGREFIEDKLAALDPVPL
jgi:5-methylcytosine-specific restriction endonuclease McrA